MLTTTIQEIGSDGGRGLRLFLGPDVFKALDEAINKVSENACNNEKTDKQYGIWGNRKHSFHKSNPF